MLDAEIFVAVLGASNYTYAEATWTQTPPDWIEAHVRMFCFLGGVPRLVVPDNLKSGVQRASFYDPEINRSYGMMAAHYGISILPARSRKPRDEAKVEARDRFRRWGASIGSNAEGLVIAILANRPHPEQGFRTGLGILCLSKDIAPERAEIVAARAIAIGALTYKSIGAIIANKTDRKRLRTTWSSTIPISVAPATSIEGTTTMLIHPILDLLGNLGLHGMAKGFRDLEARPEANLVRLPKLLAE